MRGIFGEPSLTGIALALSVTFVLTAMSTQHYALMRRAMQFRHIAMIDISANLVGSIVSVAHGAYRLGLLVAGRKADRDGGLDRRRRLDELPLGARAAAHFART